MNTTVARAIEMLFEFSADRPVLTAQELAMGVGMTRSTAYRYIQVLKSADMLEDAGVSGYRLGPGILRLAKVARKGWSIVEVARPVMHDLAARTGESVLLTRRFGAQVVCLDVIAGVHPLRLSFEEGQLLPIHAGAAARVLLAFESDETIEAVLAQASMERFTEKTITDIEELREDVAVIRDQGYSFTDQEIDEGVRGVACPVFGESGAVVGAIGCAWPAHRWSSGEEARLILDVQRAAEETTHRLTAVAYTEIGPGK